MGKLSMTAHLKLEVKRDILTKKSTVVDKNIIKK